MQQQLHDYLAGNPLKNDSSHGFNAFPFMTALARPLRSLLQREKPARARPGGTRTSNA
jgi:hypothetical protein